MLGTQLYTKEGQEIIKIRHNDRERRSTHQSTLHDRRPLPIPHHQTVETKNSAKLQKALHTLLDPFRINRSREFFTERCLPHVEQIVTIHAGIQNPQP